MIKRILALVFVAVVAILPALAQSKTKKAGGDADLKARLMKMENALWEGWKNGDAKPFEASVTDNGMEITPGGMNNREAILKGVSAKDCQVSSYSLDEAGAQLLTIDKDAAIVVYKATADATCGGQKIPTDFLCTTTWVKRGAEWKALLHQETVPMGGPPAQKTGE